MAGLFEKSRENNFTYLLVGLILYLLVGPIAQEFFPESILSADMVLRIGFNVMLILGVWSFRDSLNHIKLGWGLTIGVVILTLMTVISDSVFIEHALFLVFFIFCLVSLRLCLLEVVHGGEIDSNRLVGAACVYLLMGVCWGVLFYYVEVISPGSFNAPPFGSREQSIQDFLYYSFVTLTTLGYGDMFPLGPVAQTLSYLEAVSGTIYLAILVGALVGAFYAREREIIRRSPARHDVGPSGDAEEDNFKSMPED
jgi:hypothetical protein